MAGAVFKVLKDGGREQRRYLTALGCPDFVAWSLVAPHAKQAMTNHGQTLERLDERGGLSPCELVAVLEDRKWKPMPTAEAVGRVLLLIALEQPAASVKP